MNKMIKKVWFENNSIFVNTTDGELLSQQLEIYPILFEANQDERNNFYIWDDGQSIRWEDLDEDINIEDLQGNEIVNYNNETNKLLTQFPYLNLKIFAEYIGMHWTKLARFKYGVWTPSEEEFNEIRNGLHKIGREMMEAV